MLLLSFDPGKSTGIALGEYFENKAYELKWAWIVHDGVGGLIDWWQNHNGLNWYDSVVVSERFILRDNGWLADLEAVKIEGALQALCDNEIQWQLRTAKSLVPDSVLKENGMWQTGRPMNHSDGRDANDALCHAIGWLVRQNHRPTIEAYFGAMSEDE